MSKVKTLWNMHFIVRITKRENARVLRARFIQSIIKFTMYILAVGTNEIMYYSILFSTQIKK